MHIVEDIQKLDILPKIMNMCILESKLALSKQMLNVSIFTYLVKSA